MLKPENKLSYKATANSSLNGSGKDACIPIANGTPFNANARARFACEPVAVMHELNNTIRSTPRGEYVADRPITPQDVAATVFHHLGIDSRRVTFHDTQGRPVPLIETGEPIRELLRS